MKKYLVTKSFYKLSDKKNYNIGDTIELSDLDAIEKEKEGLISIVKKGKK